MSATHYDVQAAVKVERDYQDRKWGSIEDHPHDVGAWITILRKELREAEDEWCKEHGHQRALCEILQVAAVAFACLEQHGIMTRFDLDRLLRRDEPGDFGRSVNTLVPTL